MYVGRAIDELGKASDEGAWASDEGAWASDEGAWARDECYLVVNHPEVLISAASCVRLFQLNYPYSNIYFHNCLHPEESKY